jgi:hypothetical protein
MSGPMPVGSRPGSLSGPVQVATRLLVGRTGMRVTEGLTERLAACLDGAALASGRTPEGHTVGLAGDPGAFQELLDCVTVQESGFFRQGRQGARRAYAAALAALERCDQGAVEAGLDGWRAGGLAGVLRAKLGRTAGGDRP